MLNKRDINRKTLQIGGYVSFICIAVTVCVIAFNLLIGLIPGNIAIKDTSRNEFFTFTDNTEKLVKSITSKVNLYYVCDYGSEDNYVKGAVTAFAELNSSIKLSQIKVSSSIAKKYIGSDTEIESNTLIFVSGNNSKVLNYSDIYLYSADYTNGTYKVNFNLEKELFIALCNVCEVKAAKAYCTEGHGETTISEQMKSKLCYDNVEYVTFSLSSGIPTDADCVIMANPTSDINETELKILTEYFENGGKIFISYNATSSEYANINSLFDSFNLKSNSGIILETNAENTYSEEDGSYPYLVIPTVENTEYTESLYSKGAKMLIVMGTGIEVIDNYSDNVSVTPLCTTSETSFLRAFGSDSTDFTKGENDLSGPFYAAVLVQSNSAENKGELIWITSESFFDSSVDDFTDGANSGFISESVRYLTDAESSGAVSKSFGTDLLEITSAQKTAITIMLVILIPSLFAVLGIYTVKKRKQQ